MFIIGDIEMNIELTDEFKDKINKLMNELGITGIWQVDVDIDTFWPAGDSFSTKGISYKLKIEIDIPDKYIKIT